MRRYPPRVIVDELHRHNGWSPTRDRAAQARFRKNVLARDGYTCQRCGRHDPTGRLLEAHHLEPGYETHHGVTLCNSSTDTKCHKAEDPHAR